MSWHFMREHFNTPWVTKAKNNSINFLIEFLFLIPRATPGTSASYLMCFLLLGGGADDSIHDTLIISRGHTVHCVVYTFILQSGSYSTLCRVHLYATVGFMQYTVSCTPVYYSVRLQNSNQWNRKMYVL